MINKKYGSNSMSAGKEVELLKLKIVHRPSEILIVHNELFKVSERALIYKPMYKVTINNLKTEKLAVLIIDAITGKTSKEMQQKPKAQKKTSVKKSMKQSLTKKKNGKIIRPIK